MLLETMAALKEFDNAHDFERMCADLLRAEGYKEVILMAPRGGKDGGQDIIFTTGDGSKGLACVTLRQDIEKKFNEDFLQRKPGEYTLYVLFCTAYLTFEQKLKFAKHCANKLEALFTPYDVETVRGLLDVHQDIRERYLHIPDQSRLRQQETLAIVSNQIKANELFKEAQQAMANYDWDSAEALMQLAFQYFSIPEAPCYYGVQMSAALTEEFKRKHDVPPGYRQNALFYDIPIHLQFFAPPIERAIYWLDRARKQNEREGEKVAAARVLQELAFLHGLTKNYDEMLLCIKEAISISADTSRTSFTEPHHLAMLVHGCINEPDQAGALQELGKLLKLRLPVSPQVVQHSISDSDYSICWIVVGKEDAWIGRPKPDVPNFPMQLWIKTGYDGGTTGRIATYPNPHEPGKNTLIPPDGNGIPLDQLVNQLADQFLFICHLPANPQYTP